MVAVRSILASLALTLSCAALPAAACTPAPGYRAPSNLELAGDAEAIVLAKVVAGALDENEDPFASTITLRPLETIKGTLPEGDIALYGMMLSRDADPELGMVSSPYEFDRAHPVSYIGACVRFIFPLGTTALFFLRRDEKGNWVPAGGAFSRWAEDVPDADAPWVRLVRLYARAAALPEGERAPLLESERATLQQRVDDPVAQLMAADIRRQVEGRPQPAAAIVFSEQSPAEVESAVEAALRQMRRAAIEAGN